MGNAPQVLGGGLIERVLVTDSVLAPQIAGAPVERRVSVVSCAALFAEAIRRSYTGGSISDLMQS